MPTSGKQSLGVKNDDEREVERAPCVPICMSHRRLLSILHMLKVFNDVNTCSQAS